MLDQSTSWDKKLRKLYKAQIYREASGGFLEYKEHIFSDLKYYGRHPSGSARGT